MKFNAIALVMSTATTFAIPAVLAASEAGENLTSWESACFDEDGPCNALKQAATAVRDSLGSDLQASAQLHDISCYAKGAPCNVAKREALAMAEAVAEAYAMALPKATASLLERSTGSTVDESEADEDEDEKLPAQPLRRTEGAAGLQNWCGAHGDACTADAAKVKKAVDVLIKATDGFNSEGKHYERRFNWKMKWCHGVGEPCFKVKRAFEHLDAFLKA